jgi:hypothetical protein
VSGLTVVLALSYIDMTCATCYPDPEVCNLEISTPWLFGVVDMVSIIEAVVLYLLLIANFSFSSYKESTPALISLWLTDEGDEST